MSVERPIPSREDAVDLDKQLEGLERLIRRSREATFISVVIVPSHDMKDDVVRWIQSRVANCVVLQGGASTSQKWEGYLREALAHEENPSPFGGFVAVDIGNGEERTRLLNDLNVHVDAFRREVHGPVIFVVDEQECRSLQEHASDLFDRRAGTFTVTK